MQHTLLLGTLTKKSCLQMFDHKFLLDPELELSEEERKRIQSAISQDHYHIAMADTGYVPRIVHHLLDLPAHAVKPETDWGKILQEHEDRTELTLEDLGGPESAEAIIHYALSAQLVQREFKLSGGMPTVQDLLKFLRKAYLLISVSTFFLTLKPSTERKREKALLRIQK